MKGRTSCSDPPFSQTLCVANLLFQINVPITKTSIMKNSIYSISQRGYQTQKNIETYFSTRFTTRLPTIMKQTFYYVLTFSFFALSLRQLADIVAESFVMASNVGGFGKTLRRSERSLFFRIIQQSCRLKNRKIRFGRHIYHGLVIQV